MRHSNAQVRNVPVVQNGALSEQPDGPTYDLLMAGLEALDLVNVGLAVIGAGGSLLLANRTAEQIFESRDGLELTARRTLRTSKRSTPSLEDLVRQVTRPSDEAPAESILAVRRSSAKRPLTLLIRAVQDAPPRPAPDAPIALIFILDPDVPLGTAETELRQLYGLTSTEASLAGLLMEGKTLDDCCEVLAIRRSTVRTHLQHLFEKVGVQRQSELVSVLLKSVGLVRIGTKRRDAGRQRG